MIISSKDTQFSNHHKNIMNNITDEMNQKYTDLHTYGNQVLKQYMEYEKNDFESMKTNIMLFNERRGEKSRWARDEHDASRLIVFRLHVIKSLVKKYEAGIEQNENNVILDIYKELVRGKVSP